MYDRLIDEFQYNTDNKVYSVTSTDTTPFLQFELLRQFDEIEHCFTTKLGGVSKGIYESLNLSYTRGDDEEDVTENYRRVAELFGKTIDSVICTDQTHTTNVRRVTIQDAGKGVVSPRDYSDIDGLVTNESGIILSGFYADCVPLFFYDPVNRAIGVAHSGWRGTVGEIGRNVIDVMGREFGSKPEDIYAAIGPSICQDCYEISEDVAEQFRKFPWALDILRTGNPGHYYLDLWRCNREILLDSGIMPEHLAVNNLCTCCNSKLLFSHRATAGKRGNLGAFMMIK